MQEPKRPPTNDVKESEPHKPKIEDEKPGQSAVGKHSKTQREKNGVRELSRCPLTGAVTSTAWPNSA